MKLELTINLCSANLARGLTAILCVVGAFTLSADTALYDPFTTGEDLTAGKLNANFQEIISDVDLLKEQAVKSNGGPTRIEAARISWSGGTPTESAAWITSVTDTATGIVTVSLDGSAFSSAPSCVCTPTLAGGNNARCTLNAVITPSTLVFRVSNGANVDIDVDNIEVVCVGLQ
jgi:hypothetical protein